MKFAILSDIHANLTALKTALADARQLGAEKTICLGDVVGYGPQPEETVQFVRRAIDVTIMGNHDAAVSAVITGDNFTLHALRGVQRHRLETSPESRQWLANLPYHYQEGTFACAHGEFANEKAFLYASTPPAAMASWACRSEALLFVGHTHARAVFTLDAHGGIAQMRKDVCRFTLQMHERYFVNVGSVGYPRYDGDSTYALYDDQAHVLELRRLPFDFKVYERQMAEHDAALPGWFEEVRRKKKKKWFKWW